MKKNFTPPHWVFVDLSADCLVLPVSGDDDDSDKTRRQSDPIVFDDEQDAQASIPFWDE